jgi:hypothetical protein
MSWNKSSNMGINNNLDSINTKLIQLNKSIKEIDISGGTSSDVNITNTNVPVSNSVLDSLIITDGLLQVNTTDVSLLATQETQLDLLTLAERQDLHGVKINQDHPPLTTYDFNNNHTTMTMKGPTTEDLRWTIDKSNNRNGWKFSNGNGDTDGGNCYWYSNGAGQGNQTNLMYQDITSFYTVVSIDRVDSVNDCPFIACYSPPTGTNDVIPTFAHSRWIFSISSGTQLFSSEKVLLYYGSVPNVHTNLRHLSLSLVNIGSNGERLPTEIIYLMTVNTASARPVGSVNYILHNAGFTTILVNREYEFNNSLERLQLSNLSAENIKVQVSNFPLPLSNIDVSNFPAVQEVNGTVAISNTSFDVSNFPATQPVSGTVAISNTVFDSHMYANSSGSNQVKVHCDNQGYLLMGISDASENRCTTSAVNGSQCLDVKVLNGTSTTPIYTRALTSSDVISSNTRSGSGTSITSTTVSTKTGLDVNVINSGTSSIPVSGTFWQTTQPVSGTFWQTTQPVSMTYSSTNPLYCTPGVDVGTLYNTGWNNSSLTSASVSTSIDIQFSRTISALCRAGGAGTLVIQVSPDNTNWYTTTTTITLSGTADTVVNYNDIGSRYIRLKSNSTVAGVYATITGK